MINDIFQNMVEPGDIIVYDKFRNEKVLFENFTKCSWENKCKGCEGSIDIYFPDCNQFTRGCYRYFLGDNKDGILMCVFDIIKKDFFKNEDFLI